MTTRNIAAVAVAVVAVGVLLSQGVNARTLEDVLKEKAGGEWRNLSWSW